MKIEFLLRQLALAAALLAGAPAWAGSGQVHEYSLDNGMRVIVKEDHRAPVVVSQVWYRIGSSYERAGITGISHVLEHMMFKGTEKHGPGEFSRIIAENGGRENAFTSRDYTAYFQQLEKSRLPVALELEADRMRNLLLPEDEFRKEVQVVMEERRLRTEDKPEALTFEQFNATAFLNSPYRNPVIGWMTDLESLDIGDLEDWYRRWYAPNNAILVVVGDVDPDAVAGLAAKHFGPLRAEDVEPSKPRTEVEQKGVRRIQVQAPAEVPYILLGYKVPVLLTAEESWEPYALEVLAGILDGGQSARLSRILVRDRQLVAEAAAGYDLHNRQQSLFLLDATPAEGVDVDTVEQALRGQIRRLRSEPVSPAELERVKAQVVADRVYQDDSIFYQAMKIGMLESVGLDWRVGEEYVERIQSVTAEQLQAVARKYLIEQRLTIARLDPLPMDAEARARARAAGMGDTLLH